jgi:hypothetical protein
MLAEWVRRCEKLAQSKQRLINTFDNAEGLCLETLQQLERWVGLMCNASIKLCLFERLSLVEPLDPSKTKQLHETSQLVQDIHLKDLPKSIDRFNRTASVFHEFWGQINEIDSLQAELDKLFGEFLLSLQHDCPPIRDNTPNHYTDDEMDDLLLSLLGYDERPRKKEKSKKRRKRRCRL